jgi:hypothetical protein
VNFNNLFNLILEGDGDPLYDLNPDDLNEKDILNLTPDVAKKLSIQDKNKRLFKIQLNGELFETQASSKNEAIGNIGFRLADAAKIRPNIVIFKMRKNNTKVFDDKWKVKY